jgi:hypothetical protein
VTDGSSDDRELRGDKGQTCGTCGEHFKYQYLYDDHVPCRAGAPDPTTAAITAQTSEREQLRAEVERLERALVAAYTDVEVAKSERDRLSKLGDTLFEKGYDQAAREIRDHFAKSGDHGVVHVIESIWQVAFRKERPR